MKNKSARHKEENTFKFLPFSERLAAINIDIFHRVSHAYEDVSEDVCYFYQDLEKWEELNLTEGFESFLKEIKVNTVLTLPQLLFHKDRVVDTLLKYLEAKDPLYLQPILSLTLSLARDLRKEFYEHYPRFYKVLVELLDTKNTDQLEWVFQCLAYFFKFLWRYLIQDIEQVFKSLIPLLSENKPEFINNFAAESFAFVARKVKDRQAFLTLLLKTVQNEEEGIIGCGCLLFEVIKGVDGQFHSCAEEIIPFYLETLSSLEIYQSTFMEILEYTISHMVYNIKQQHSEVFWKSSLAHLDKLTETWRENNTESNCKNLENLLKVLGQAIEHKNGKFVFDSKKLIEKVSKLLICDNLPEDILLIILQISTVILLSTNIKLTQEEASLLVKNSLNVNNSKCYLWFIDHIVDFVSFGALILPHYVKQCTTNNLEKDYLRSLTKVILKKAPLCFSGANITTWSKYTINLKGYDEDGRIEKKLLDILREEFKDVESFFCTLVCLPHFNLRNKDDFKSCLSLVVENLLKEDKDTKNLFLLNVVIECLIHLNHKSFISENFSNFLDILLGDVNNDNILYILNILSLLIVAVKEESVINIGVLRQLNAVFERYFNYPYHEVRILLTFIYSIFEDIPEFDLEHSSDPEVAKVMFRVFRIFYKIENVDSQIDTYRQQIRYLEKLEFEKPQMIMCDKTEFRSIPLRYMCGMLYMNFQLLWEPILKTIETHAHGLETSCFWNVYGEVVKEADALVKREQDSTVTTFDSDFEILEDTFGKWQSFQSKPDFVNHRLLLWKGLGLFPDVAEAKTRDVSELLLQFYEEEFTKQNPELSLTWNIKQRDLDLYTIDEEADEKIENKHRKNPSKLTAKTKLNTFLQYLAVFSKIKSPKSMFREKELYNLYYELLQHKNSKIQRAALDCLLTYRQKFLLPYKEHLCNLIDDKNFKNELAVFNIDRDGATVSDDHRPDLMPVVFRIVYSKMNAKIGLRTGGKGSAQTRRALVMRFLGGCHEKEKITFVRMVFRHFDKYVETDLKEIVRNVNLEKFANPKRLQSSVNMLNVILEQFGDSLANELLGELLRYICVIGSFIKGAYQQIGKIHVGYHNSLKLLKTSCTKLIHSFFDKFQYAWTNRQINDIFDIFIWPYLDKLDVEGIHSPTSLLKLLILWGSHPRYFPLLVKREDGNENHILPKVMELLLNPKSHFTVVNAILEMVEKLLSLQPDEEDEKSPVPVDNVLPINDTILERIKVNDKLNYGSCILLAHSSSVLTKIKRNLERKSKNISKLNLSILSRISELVWEADISEQTLKLLIPVILKKHSDNLDEDVVNQFLVTVKSLLQNVTKPFDFLRPISPLLGEVKYASSRKLLLSIIEIALGDASSAQILAELNAFDSRWVDQPDFQKRHDAFKLIFKMIEDDSLEIKLGVLILFTSYYFLCIEKDLSIKENSSHLLKTLSPYLLKKYQRSRDENEYLLTTLFELIRKGIKNKNVDSRNECISLLGHLARKCSQSHFILRDLHVFTNDSDLEVDVFENLTHLQIHRHTRALVKFCQLLRKETNAPNAQTLTRFVIPLVSSYLCDEKHLGKNSLIDAAIDAIGCICRVLPYQQYEALLKFYLGKLRGRITFQKQLVKLTVAILDAFHFDLTKAHVTDKEKPVSVEESKDETPKEDKDEEVEGEVVDEDLDEAMQVAEDQQGSDYEEDEQEPMKVCEKINVLCKSTATRVVYNIKTILLPQLNNTLAELTRKDSSHKVNRKLTSNEQEEEDLIKVPLSLAVVKLLQRLPKVILDHNLPRVFMKTCTFLKSHLESVRRVARETLEKIMLSLGPSYLPSLLSEMTPLLQRGFEAHVLVFTVHGVLNRLKEQYQPNDIDKIVLTVTNLCKADLFGILSEEKEVAKIKVKLSEAKSSKSLDTYQIVAEFITERCLMDLMLPIKSILETSTSFKTVYKAQEVLRCISMGLIDNKFVSTESLLKFAYGAASEKIPQLVVGKEKPETEENARDKKYLVKPKRDCFLISKDPVRRSGASLAQNSGKTNAHLLVEFGLKLCFLLLKRDRVKEETYLPFLDPFVPLFKDCLSSKHVKLCTVTLQCLCWAFKFDLPSMKQHVKTITSDIFAILHKYAAAGLSKGDNFDLVVAAFKAMSILVRNVKYHTIDTDQLNVLLLYVEQDMYDHDRQAVAFNLLKAILARKLIIPEIHDVIKKVAELSITSEMDYVRNQSRNVFHQYAMDYPLGRKLDDYIAFYLSQTAFELHHGRESAIEMILTLIRSFPLGTLTKQSGTIFIELSARLFNEDHPELKKTIATCLALMLRRLPEPDRQTLFEMVTLWFAEKKIDHRTLAAEVCGIFVRVEKDQFETRLPIIIPIILKQFGLDDKPGKFVKLKKTDEDDNEEKISMMDHLHCELLTLLCKLCAQCPKFLKQDVIQDLAAHCQALLGHPHELVRLGACQFLAFVFTTIDIDRLSDLLVNNKQEEKGYLFTDPEESLMSLALDLCDQLHNAEIRPEFAEQVVKNLVFISKVIQKVPIKEDTKKINLLWLCKRLRKEVNWEVVKSPSRTVIRTQVFRWIGGITLVLSTEAILSVIHHLMAPLVREMITTEESNAPLRQLSKEACRFIKEKIGFEAYTENLSKIEQNLSIKRAERKRSKNQLAVVDPELHAKKKIKKHDRLKNAKKRKIEEHKGVKRNYKKRKTDNLDNSEII